MDYISKNYKRTYLYSGLHGYHAHHGCAMNDPKGYSVKKGRIGVELEVEFTDYDKCSEFKRAKSNWFYLERDGSIGGHNTEGVEIITIPLRPQDAKDLNLPAASLPPQPANRARTSTAHRTILNTFFICAPP